MLTPLCLEFKEAPSYSVGYLGLTSLGILVSLKCVSWRNTNWVLVCHKSARRHDRFCGILKPLVFRGINLTSGMVSKGNTLPGKLTCDYLLV